MGAFGNVLGQTSRDSEIIGAAQNVFGTVSVVGDGSLVVVDNAIAGPIVIGDDYLAANLRSFVFDFEAPPDVSVASKVWFQGRHRYDTRYSWLVEGAISFPNVGEMRISFDLPGSATALLIPGEYIYQLYVITDSGKRISPAASIERPVDLIGIPDQSVAC